MDEAAAGLICLKCGAMNAASASTCSKCANGLIRPETHPLPVESSKPFGILTYAGCGALVLFGVILVILAFSSIGAKKPEKKPPADQAQKADGDKKAG
jgi:ribosomal protein L40E